MEDNFEKFNRLNEIVSPADVFDSMGAVLAKNDGLKLTYACPYHTDDSPSLLVDLNNGAYNCFACECGGVGGYSAAKYYLKFQNNSKPSTMMVVNFLEEINPRVAEFKYLFEVRREMEYDFTQDKRSEFKNRFRLPDYEIAINVAKKSFTPEQMRIYIDAIMNNLPSEFIFKALKLESKEEVQKGSEEFLSLLGLADEDNLPN